LKKEKKRNNKKDYVYIFPDLYFGRCFPFTLPFGRRFMAMRKVFSVSGCQTPSP
jgi:hypothetical protein